VVLGGMITIRHAKALSISDPQVTGKIKESCPCA